MHRLLQNTFLHYSCQSNFIILCLNNDDKIEDKYCMVNKIKQILCKYKCFFTRAIYADIVKIEEKFEIILYKTYFHEDSTNIFFTKSLAKMTKSNGYSIDYIWNNLIDTKIMFDINVDKDEIIIYDGLSENLYMKQYNELKHHVLNADINLHYIFKRYIYVKDDKQIELKYILHFVDQKNSFNSGFLFECIYLYELKKENYTLISTNDNKHVESFFRQIEIHRNYNPYFTDILILTYDGWGQSFNHSIKQKFDRFDIYLFILYKNVKVLFFGDNVYISKIDILKFCAFDLSCEFKIKYFDFEPNGKKNIASNQKFEWVPLLNDNQLNKIMLTDQIIVRITYTINEQNRLFYLIIGSKHYKSFSKMENGVFEVFTLIKYDNHIKKYITEKKIADNDKKDKLEDMLNKIGKVCFENFCNVKHYLCMTDAIYRKKYCKQVVFLFFLLYVIGPEKNYEHRISEFSNNDSNVILFIEKVLSINYHSNCFLLDDNDTETEYFCHKKMRFIHPVSSEVFYKSVQSLYLEIFDKEIEMESFIIFLVNFYEKLLENYMKDMDRYDITFVVKSYFSDQFDNPTMKDIFESFVECLKNQI
ncbi:hypothetical protein COBT_002184 [Conglomerata obtusa]